MLLFFPTIDGTREGAAGHFYPDPKKAQAVVDKKNAKAESLNMKTRYCVGTEEDEDSVPKTERRML